MTVDLTAYVHRDDGHDGSHYQPDAGPMDLVKVRAIPMDWLGWKTTQSTAGVDPSFPAVDAQAEAFGFRWFLPYGWLSSTTDPAAQADHYLAHCGKIREGKGAMCDAEEKGITVAKCLTWLERTEDEFKRPSSVYTGLYVAGGTIWRSPEIRMSKYGLRPMHLAAYITAQGLVVRLQALGITELQIHAWQWTSNGILTTGAQMPGITGRADINTIVTPAMMDLACGVAAPNPNPLPEDDDMAIVTNSEQRSMPYGDAAPGTAIFVAGLEKRNIGAEEYKAVYGNAAATPLSNAALDAIPDVGVSGGVVDQVARDSADHANEAVTRIGRTISDIRIGGQRIADAGG